MSTAPASTQPPAGPASSSPAFLPLPFPQPRVHTNSLLRSARLRTSASTGSENITEISILESPTGNYFEVSRRLKETIYGQLHHGIHLRLCADGIFERSQPIQQVAIKIYSRQKITNLRGKTQENPATEIAALQYVGSHPNVIRLYESSMDAASVYSILEFCDGGELFEMVEMDGALGEDKARTVFLQIVSGLAHLHSVSIGHRDLSLENVLFQRSTGLCKIIDFGMCLLLPRHQISEEFAGIPCLGMCGKKSYVAPEVVSNAPIFRPDLVDIWALGIILFILLAGVPLVEIASDVDQRFRMVREGRLAEMIDQWGLRISPEAIDLLNHMIRANPAERISLLQIQAHPWCRPR